MPAYAVFEPPARANRPLVDHAARFVFLRDRFSWGAFLLGPLWMIWRRLWLVLLVYIVLVAAIEYGLRRFAIPATARTIVYLLVALLVGIEAPGLRRWTLLRRGWHERGVVVDLASGRGHVAIIPRSTPSNGKDRSAFHSHFP